MGPHGSEVSKGSKGSKLATWILVAAAAGIVAGWAGNAFSPDAATAATVAGYFSILSDVFLRLIKMIIAPLVFATVVSGITGMGDAKAVGRIGGKALLWFITASLVSLLIGMFFANLLQPGTEPRAPAAREGHGDQPEDRRPEPARVHRARLPAQLLRGDGHQRDPADPRLLVLLRLRDRIAEVRAREDGDLVHQRARPGDAQGHRLRDVVRAGGRLRRRRRGDHHPGPRRPGHLRQVHRVVLRRAARPVGAADRRRLRVPRAARVPADGPGQGAAAGRVHHRQQRGGLPEADGAAAPLRRQRPRDVVRAAARLLVQPRRLDAVPGLRGAVHRAGLRHRDVASGSSSRCCW